MYILFEEEVFVIVFEENVVIAFVRASGGGGMEFLCVFGCG